MKRNTGKQKSQKLVTKEFLKRKVEEDPNRTIGRALVAIFNNQTDDEQCMNTTRNKNGIGFTQSDARVGSLGAKYYKESGVLPPWQLRLWTSPNRHGEPRICKYANQLNAIAIRKTKNNLPNEPN